MRRSILLLCLVSASAIAQVPLPMPQFVDPPESNGASAVTFPRHILWNSTLTCLQRPTGSSWQCFTTAAEVASTYMPTATANAAIAVVNARIDTVQASIPTVPHRCATTVATGLSIPLLGVQTAPISVTISGAQVGAPCEVGSTSFDPVGAEGKCRILTAGTATLRWVANAGPLSAVLAIPNGTYTLCATVVP